MDPYLSPFTIHFAFVLICQSSPNSTADFDQTVNKSFLCFFLFENETFCSDFPTLCSFMQKHKIEYYVMYLNICKTFFAKIYIFCGLWIYSS